MKDCPTMHYHSELLNDLGYQGALPDSILLKWFQDSYSTSKHLLTLYSIGRGLKAKNILEIGFGRSSFVLARNAIENNGRLFTCDTRDFSYLLNSTERASTEFIHAYSDLVWSSKSLNAEGIDFSFLDYFSGESVSTSFSIREIWKCLKLTKENGIIAVHDVFDGRYKVGKALNLLSLCPGIEVSRLGYNYGLGIIRKTSSSKFGKIQESFLKKV